MLEIPFIAPTKEGDQEKVVAFSVQMEGKTGEHMFPLFKSMFDDGLIRLDVKGIADKPEEKNAKEEEGDGNS